MGYDNLSCIWLTKSLYYSFLYQIAHLGDEDDEPEFSSAMPLEEGDTFFFAPRPLRNLVLVDELDSLSPILGKYTSHVLFVVVDTKNMQCLNSILSISFLPIITLVIVDYNQIQFALHYQVLVKGVITILPPCSSPKG